MTRALGEPANGEAHLLAAARGGDDEAVRRLFEPSRRELHAHCYRMLASTEDADDAVQEALLRAWRALPEFQARSSLRSWLYRIATNVCLNALEKRSRRVLPLDHKAGAEPPAWVEPYPDERVLGVTDDAATPHARYEQRESLELAFVVALQVLPPRQRAALILRDVLGYSAAEAADSIGTSTVAINSALQHARAKMGQRLPEVSQQQALRTLGDARLASLVGRYCGALEQGDVQAVLGLLTADVTWSMPPAPQWFDGREQVMEFLVEHPMTVRWQHRLTRANGQVAVAWYRQWAEGEPYRAEVLDVLTLAGERVSAVTAFIGGERFARFGLDAAVEGPR